MNHETHEHWMRTALELARRAGSVGEVPVGAVVTFHGQLVGWGVNTREGAQTPLGHAELMAIRKASAVLGRWRLWGCTLYVTLEPCPMCAGAIVHARFPRVVFGATDPRTGACGSIMNLVQHASLNHRVELIPGILSDESSTMIREFFSELRRRRSI